MKHLFSALALASVFIACQQSPTTLETPQQAIGTVQLTFDLQAKTAQAAFISNGLRPQAVLNPQTAVSFASSSFQSISSGSDNFLNATFNVSNTSGGALTDLTLVAYRRNNNRVNTAISNLQNFQGLSSPALDTYALAAKPTNGMTNATTVNSANADLQLFTESEVSSLTTDAGTLLQAGEFLLPYGYVARATGSSTSRSVGNGSNTGTLTVGLKVPNSNEPGSQVYRFSMTFLVFTTPVTTRVSESLEEQASSGAVARGNATGFNTNQVSALAGSSIAQTEDKLVNVCRVRTAGTAASPSAFLVATAPSTTAGSFDQCFAAQGKRQLNTNASGQSSANGSERFTAMAVQSDNKIVLAGWSIQQSTGIDTMVVRLNQDGSLDTTFDGDGKAFINLGGGTVNDQANALLIQSDGKIVVGGYTGNSNTSFDFAVARLNTNGTLDTSFNSTGLFTSNSSFGNEDIVNALALQTVSGVNYIVVAGTSRENNTGSTTGNPVNGHGALFRLKVLDGTLDTTFGSSGYRNFSFAGSSSTPLSGSNEDFVNGVAVDASNRIIVAGNDFLNGTPSVTNAGVIRFTTGGAWDIKAVTDIVSGGIGGLVIESTNATTTSLVVFGSGTNTVGTLTNTDPMAIKFTLGASSGAVDTTWGNQSTTNGRTYIRVNPSATSTNFGVARAAARQSDGKIILAGRQRFNGNGLSAGDTVLIRLNTNGTADTGFDTDGIVTIQRQNGNVDEAWAASVNSGKILIAGYERTSSNTPIQDDSFVLQFNP
jgi:uncharacterized delta-60 repeat protein